MGEQPGQGMFQNGSTRQLQILFGALGPIRLPMPAGTMAVSPGRRSVIVGCVSGAGTLVFVLGDDPIEGLALLDVAKIVA